MIKALSIRQPWAWCILHAGKDIENRSWSSLYRGPLLIHASAGMTRVEYEFCLGFCHQVSKERPFLEALTMPAFHDLQRGGIVGQVNVVDCVSKSTSPWFIGEYGLVLADPKLLPFRPYKGRLGFFSVDD